MPHDDMIMSWDWSVKDKLPYIIKIYEIITRKYNEFIRVLPGETEINGTDGTFILQWNPCALIFYMRFGKDRHKVTFSEGTLPMLWIRKEDLRIIAENISDAIDVLVKNKRK